MILTSNEFAIANRNRNKYLKHFILAFVSAQFSVFRVVFFSGFFVTIDLLMFIIIYVCRLRARTIWSQRLHVNFKWYLNVGEKIARRRWTVTNMVAGNTIDEPRVKNTERFCSEIWFACSIVNFHESVFAHRHSHRHRVIAITVRRQQPSQIPKPIERTQ